MGTTYAKLLQELKQVQAAPYASDPERAAAILQAMQDIMQDMLEMLSRAAGDSAGQPQPIHRS